MTSHSLRRARPDDVETIARLWAGAWADGHVGHVPHPLVELRTADDFRRRVPPRLPRTTVATVEGTIVGFVSVKGDELEELFVDRSARGGGVATALLGHGEAEIGRDHRRAWLAVVAGNARARRFYAREGWSDDGPFDYAADGLTVRCQRYVKDLR